MGKLRKLKRNLRIDKVQLAEQTKFEQIKLVKEMCVKRATEDAGFAKEILDAVGDVLPPEVKKAAEESVAKASLPLDPLIEGNAPETDYPENQGIGAALGRAMK